MFTHTLKCPSQFMASIYYKHKTHIKARSNSALVVQQSSILVHTDENNNLFEFKKSWGSCAISVNSQVNSPLASHVNTIGIIGGVSTISTVNFLEKLEKWSSKDGEDENLPFVVCSDPMLNKDLLSHKSIFPHRETENVHLELDHDQILENLRLKKTFLEKSGASCIVMPCDISHMWHGEISKGCSVPFLHVGECVANELKEANFKPIEAGSGLRIGVLSTDANLTADVYQEKLQSQGFEAVLLDKATTEHTIIPAVEALNRNDIVGARNLLRIALQVLLVRAVNTVILASDDIRDLLPHNDPLLRKCFDPMDALARSTIKWAQSTYKANNKS